ncbi:PREDICTED: uncharacterized protein LOC107188484 isoform X1 [Dufourea novaeangliae]|uniref:uncharacterized protein LOC107188484 isoform X1 n=1 Tax=Dufourea novaeangliae TaxID=178035 RepID=UPI00076780B2|nr:PREDICTED: uncharacterized protein LOC107188484 isoform X1 [Dufourea novaeangliae]
MIIIKANHLRLINRNIIRARLTLQYPSMDVEDGHRFRSVRRRLFQDNEDENHGDSDRNSGVEDNLANCFYEEARKNRENAKERWNFDFEKEEPLPGRYVWVKLDQHGNEVGNPLETRNRVENLQIVHDDDAQDDDFAMQDQPEDKDEKIMTDST